VAYKLVPASNLTLLAAPSSMIAQRGGFAEKNLWVTPHSDAERFPSSAHSLMNYTSVEVSLISKPFLQMTAPEVRACGWCPFLTSACSRPCIPVSR
jgi:Copper amine oxidase, enzyme domain